MQASRKTIHNRNNGIQFTVEKKTESERIFNMKVMLRKKHIIRYINLCNYSLSETKSKSMPLTFSQLSKHHLEFR